MNSSTSSSLSLVSTDLLLNEMKRFVWSRDAVVPLSTKELRLHLERLFGGISLKHRKEFIKKHATILIEELNAFMEQGGTADQLLQTIPKEKFYTTSPKNNNNNNRDMKPNQTSNTTKTSQTFNNNTNIKQMKTKSMTTTSKQSVIYLF